VRYGQNTLAAVVQGIGVLNGQSQPGSFALILDYRIVADAYSVIGDTLTTTADLITPLVTGGFFGTAALPAFTGLLVSLGGAPITIYVGIEATTAFTTKNNIEDYLFRVFERVQFDARDPRALVRLNFAPVILRLTPNNGPVNAQTPVIIEGFGSGRIESVQFDQTVIGPGNAAGQFQVVDDAHISLLTPARANAGAVDVTVTSLDDLTSAPVQFTYNP
jgi:IPT/TIG domain